MLPIAVVVLVVVGGKYGVGLAMAMVRRGRRKLEMKTAMAVRKALKRTLAVRMVMVIIMM